MIVLLQDSRTESQHPDEAKVSEQEHNDGLSTPIDGNLTPVSGYENVNDMGSNSQDSELLFDHVNSVADRVSAEEAVDTTINLDSLDECYFLRLEGGYEH